MMRIPIAAATGMDRSRNALSGIVSGCVGSHLNAKRSSVMPSPWRTAKNEAPPSPAYLPVSSATPKRRCGKEDVRWIVHEYTAGFPVLPSRSVAWTAKVWNPGERPVTVFGTTHGWNGPPSMLQEKMTLCSFAENLKVASTDGVVRAGFAVICVFGGVVSVGGDRWAATLTA